MDSEKLGGSPLWMLLFAFTGFMYFADPRPSVTGATTKSRNVPVEIAAADQEMSDVLQELQRLVSKGHRFRPLIALVPDPEPGATEAGWMFDAHADAIQRAAQSAGFLLYRRVLPDSWVPSGAASKAEKKSARHDSAGDREADSDCPGLLLFRHGANREVLAVFLVGESPTRGLNQREIARSVDWIEYQGQIARSVDWVEHQGQPFPNRELRIVGPAFSGSAWSLAQAIERLLEPPSRDAWKVEVVSGSATGEAVRSTLQREQLSRRVRFRTTVIPDEIVVQAMYRHLVRQGAALSNVAVLVESTTGYGNALFSSSFAAGGEEEDESSGSPPGRPRADSSLVEVAGPRIVFQFPLHIAQARAAYERGKPARERPSAGSFESRISQLELSLEDGDRPVAADVLPPLHSRITGYNVDLVLANILQTMSKEDIRYVMMFATDPRDKLFLARKIRESLPDVRILTTEGNLLYTHKDYRAYFDGAIVGSTYPLFSKNQLWVIPGAASKHDELLRKEDRFSRTTRVTQFSDAGAEGVYNAALALLGRTDMMKDYGPPCFADTCPESDARPPIWITAIGRGMVWPLETNSDYEDHGLLVEGESHSPDPRPRDVASGLTHTRSGASLLYLVSLFAIVNGAIIWRAWAGDAAARRGLRPVLVQPCLPANQADPRQRFWLAVLLLVLLAGQIMLLCLVAIFVRSNFVDGILAEGARWRIGFGAFAAGAGWLLVALALLRVAGDRVGSILAALILCLTVHAVVRGWVSFPGNAFFYLRATNPGSGLSPLVPILFIGVILYLWAYHHLRRLWLASIELQNPLAGRDVPGGSWVARLEDRIRDVDLRGLVGVPTPFVAGVLAIGALAWAALWFSLLPGFDSWHSDQALGGLLTVAYFAILGATIRFAWLWVSIRTLLRQIDHHPMTDAFSRLPERLREVLRRRYYAYAPGPADRLQTARLWLGIGGRYSNPLLPIARPAALATSGEPSRARNARDSLSFFDVEAKEAWKAGRTCYGSQSEVQASLSAHAADVAREILPSSPAFERRRQQAPEPVRAVLERAEEFVAIEVVASLGRKFLQLGNLITFMIGGVLLLNFAFASYPFQPQRLIMMFILALAVAVVTVLLLALFQADRDPLLSRMAGVKPGRITLDRGLVGQVLTYAVLPLVTVVATQFPETGGLFDSLFKLLK